MTSGRIEIGLSEFSDQFWHSLKNIACAYPKDPTNEDRQRMALFIASIGYIAPNSKFRSEWNRYLFHDDKDQEWKSYALRSTYHLRLWIIMAQIRVCTSLRISFQNTTIMVSLKDLRDEEQFKELVNMEIGHLQFDMTNMRDVDDDYNLPSTKKNEYDLINNTRWMESLFCDPSTHLNQSIYVQCIEMLQRNRNNDKTREKELMEPNNHDTLVPINTGTKRDSFSPTSWGPQLWVFLHYCATGLPEVLLFVDKLRVILFLSCLGFLLPCELCRRNWICKFRKLNVDRLKSRHHVQRFLVEAHMSTKLHEQTPAAIKESQNAQKQVITPLKPNELIVLTPEKEQEVQFYMQMYQCLQKKLNEYDMDLTITTMQMNMDDTKFITRMIKAVNPTIPEKHDLDYILKMQMETHKTQTTTSKPSLPMLPKSNTNNNTPRSSETSILSLPSTTIGLLFSILTGLIVGVAYTTRNNQNDHSSPKKPNK